MAPLKAEQKAERKQMKDQMGSYKTHAKSHQHTLHDETAAMNAERKARKQEDKVRPHREPHPNMKPHPNTCPCFGRL